MIAGMKAMRLAASDAESSRVGARDLGRLLQLEMHRGRGSGIYLQLKPCLHLIDAMQCHTCNYRLVRWLIGCTSLIHDSIDTCDACPSFRAALLVASLLLRRRDRFVVLIRGRTSTVRSSRGLVDLSSTLHGPGTVHAVVAQADVGTRTAAGKGTTALPSMQPCPVQSRATHRRR